MARFCLNKDLIVCVAHSLTGILIRLSITLELSTLSVESFSR